ncbi:DNA ligase/mRNA capping enzyme [Aureobasidium pullulans]|nr:DNA ligase/mRNA capping enzyme [Aureobasidium pullulans]
MSFKFAHLCDYLERCEEIVHHNPPLAPAEQKSRHYRQHASWFASHRQAIDALDQFGTSALLSTFLPCRRKDRIYSLQPASLFKLLGRCLGLSASARQELATFKTPGNGDLGECLQRLLRTRGPPPLPTVTLQEVDDALHALAAANRFSGPSVRQSFRPPATNDPSLADVLLRLHAVEAKWFVRLVLKDFSPVTVNERSILSSVHFLLPDLLWMQDDFESACTALRSTFGAYPSLPDMQSLHILRQTALPSLKPIPGIKVSRPEYTKARSIKHCLQMTSGERWLLERKYDGEYCQVHVDLTKGEDWLRIYSKSGRDSTEDRAGLRETIRKCLRIGSDKCKFERACILVGELVVFSDTENSIQGFDKIRKHVSRAGVFLGNENDSPRQSGEHLMIILFDLLLFDDETVLSRSVEERKAKLSSVYKKIHGRAAPAESCVIDFSQPKAEHRLMNQFAASIACRHEGLVLKPCGVPYFAPGSVAGIKLKKDYITGLGDEADFAVVGASYNAQEAKKRPGLHLKFTHFYLGCLLNREAIDNDGVRPIFKIVATMSYDHCMSTEILERVNIEGSLLSEPYSKSGSSTFDIESDETPRMDFCFRDPLVFEVLGSSFSKSPGGTSCYGTPVSRSYIKIQNAPLPTPPDSSPLDGHRSDGSSTAVAKRKSDDGKYDVSKRLCIQTAFTPSAIGQPQGKHVVEQRVNLLQRTPLADITPTAIQRLVESNLNSLATRQPGWTEGRCKFEETAPPAKRDTCIFAQSVVFITDLQDAEKERVRQKVLDHGALVIQDLVHWDRDSHGYANRTDTVCESQAYKGMRKMVLVDPREKQQYRTCYAEVERLGLQRVEIFDYRIVDAMCSAADR